MPRTVSTSRGRRQWRMVVVAFVLTLFVTSVASERDSHEWHSSSGALDLHSTGDSVDAKPPTAAGSELAPTLAPVSQTPAKPAPTTQAPASQTPSSLAPATHIPTTHAPLAEGLASLHASRPAVSVPQPPASVPAPSTSPAPVREKSSRTEPPVLPPHISAEGSTPSLATERQQSSSRSPREASGPSKLSALDTGDGSSAPSTGLPTETPDTPAPTETEASSDTLPPESVSPATEAPTTSTAAPSLHVTVWPSPTPSSEAPPLSPPPTTTIDAPSAPSEPTVQPTLPTDTVDPPMLPSTEPPIIPEPPTEAPNATTSPETSSPADPTDSVPPPLESPTPSENTTPPQPTPSESTAPSPLSSEPPVATDPPEPVGNEPPSDGDTPVSSPVAPATSTPPVDSDPPTTTIVPISFDPPVTSESPLPPPPSPTPADNATTPPPTETPETPTPQPTEPSPPPSLEPTETDPPPPPSSTTPTTLPPPAAHETPQVTDTTPPLTAPEPTSTEPDEPPASDPLPPMTPTPSPVPDPVSDPLPPVTPAATTEETGFPPFSETPIVTTPAPTATVGNPTAPVTSDPVASQEDSLEPPLTLSPAASITAVPPLVPRETSVAIETEASDVSAEALAKKDDNPSASFTVPPPTSTPRDGKDDDDDDDGNDDDWVDLAQPDKYVRGQTPIDDDVSDPWSEELSGGSHYTDKNNSSHNPQPLVIGGRQRGTMSKAGTPYAQASSRIHDVVRYIASSVSAISVGLLLVFHFVALDPTLQWRHRGWSPNTWEFCVYVAYLQQMAALSQLTLLKSPLFLWDFTDAYAWTNFLIQRTTEYGATGKSAVASSRRHLLERETVLILDGLVGYADRIGLNETRIMMHTVLGYVVVTGLFMAAACGVAAVATYHRQQRLGHAWSVVHRLLGICWLVWFFGLYPLSTMASFEIYMEIHSGLFTPELLVISLVVLTGVCVVMPAIAVRGVWFRKQDELREYRTIAVFGVLYVDCWYSKRLFFVLAVLVQLMTGVCVGVLDSTATLLGVLIAVHVLWIAAVVLLRPFTSQLITYATLAIDVLKIVNFAHGFAFLSSSQLSSRQRVTVANAFIALNAMVLVLWFVRLSVVFACGVHAVLRRQEQQQVEALSCLEASLRMDKFGAQEGTPGIEPTTASASRYPVFTCWSRSLSLSDSASMAWGPDTTPRAAYVPVLDSR